MSSSSLTEVLRETLALFEAPGEPRTTTEVADSLDLGRRSTYERLQRLVDHGRLETKKVGGNGRVWWRPPPNTDGTPDRSPTAESEVDDVLDSVERRLERQRDQVHDEPDEVFARIDEAFFALDEDWRFTHVNDRAAELVRVAVEELLGALAWDVLPEVTEGSLRAAAERAMETQEPFEVEFYSELLEIWVATWGYPSETGMSVFVRDITERKERERRLEQFERMVETVNDGVYATDGEGDFVFVNDAFVAMSEHTREELLGAYGSAFFGERFVDTDEQEWQELVTGESDSVTFETDITGPDGETRIVHNQFVILELGDEVGRVGVVRDVTERKRYEERLQALYDSLHELIEADTPAAISEILVERARSVLDLPGIVVYRYDDDQDLLVPEAESVEADFIREELPTVPPDDSSLTGHVYADGEPRYYEDVTDSPSVQVSPDETQMRTGLFVPLGEEGILVAGSRDIDGFDASTRQLVKLLATNAATAYDRVAREQELVHQRAQLQALNSLNEVVREISGAVINQSTREEIEATVCERLAASASYLFAWIGDVDSASQTVNLRTEAGVEGYLDGITISVDPDDERSEGPTGRALQTGEPQVTHDIRADTSHDPWREYAERYGFRSSAAIPIVHEGTIYGVINIYAGRPYAFDGQERTVISQLGEVVGHAIAAAERKQALMSDELVELEFQIQDVFGALDIPVETTGTITLDHTVPVGDGEFLVYGTATPDAVDTVTSITENLPHWRDLIIRSEGDPTSFELRMTDPPVLSVVASLGGYVERAVIEDGDHQMTIHLAPSVDVRRVTDAVEAAYPTVEMLRRRQISLNRDDSKRFQRHLLDDLTDRQRTALETAYYAGFFEWPRDTSGEEVAASIGVAPPTFHQHLRKAEGRVFDAVFSSPMQSVG